MKDRKILDSPVKLICQHISSSALQKLHLCSKIMKFKVSWKKVTIIISDDLKKIKNKDFFFMHLLSIMHNETSDDVYCLCSPGSSKT